MSTTQPTRAADVNVLRDLAELDYDLVRAYDTAISRLDDDTIRNGLRLIVEDHRDHLLDLNQEVLDLEGDAWVEEDFGHVLARGKVFLASLSGDRAILQALLNDEAEVARAYEHASEAPDLPHRVRRVLDAHLDDDREHRSWLDRALREV